MLISMTLSDLERRDARCQISRLISLITLVRLTENDQIRQDNTYGGGAYFVEDQPYPYRKGRCPSVPKFWGFLSIYAYTLCR